MKIKEVKCEVYLREPFWSHMRIFALPTSEKINLSILRIITDDGIEGFAFDVRNVTEPTISAIKREIINRDPFDREWIWQRLWYFMHGRNDGPFFLGTLSAVDIALWDLAGKALGLPVYKLLGAYRDKIRIYASSHDWPSVQEYVDEAVSCKQQGVTAYKIHPYWSIGDKDIELCRAVRKAVGADMKLMFDPVGCYSREEALRVGKVLEELNFFWFEEPIPDYDIEGLVKLKEKLSVPICAPEMAPMGIFNIPEYIKHRATDIVRCDTRFTGGITPCKKIADMCDAFGIQCEFHTFSHSGGGVPNLHVECAIKNCEFHEISWPEKRYGLKEYPELDGEGYLHVPQKPGLGIEINWEVLGEPIESY